MGFFDVVPPYAVILVGALLVALGTYAAGTRQSRNTADMKGDITTAVNLLRDIAAKSGDEKLVQQAIDLREKALESHGDLRSAAMKDVLARVP